VQIQRFAVLAKCKRHMATGIAIGCRQTEVQVFIKYNVAVWFDCSTGGNLVFHKVGAAVAEEPAADVDGGVGGVVQLYPVRGARV